MSLGVGLFLAVTGAILIWGVNVDVPEIDATVVGWILLIAGIVASLISLATGHRPTVIEDRTRD